ncbi:hypothetical protein [Amycolatopsis thailandensis]|uniref:hypothetical protein n=1 Tax=Amycolatopsis thailandensis TaxID=589330 RepID=UPI00363158EF
MSGLGGCTGVAGVDVDSAGSRVQGADRADGVGRPIVGSARRLMGHGDGRVVGGDVDVGRAEQCIVEVAARKHLSWVVDGSVVGSIVAGVVHADHQCCDWEV